MRHNKRKYKLSSEFLQSIGIEFTLTPRFNNFFLFLVEHDKSFGRKLGNAIKKNSRLIMRERSEGRICYYSLYKDSILRVCCDKFEGQYCVYVDCNLPIDTYRDVWQEVAMERSPDEIIERI
jgi:hypothetical protein